LRIVIIDNCFVYFLISTDKYIVKMKWLSFSMERTGYLFLEIINRSY